MNFSNLCSESKVAYDHVKWVAHNRLALLLIPTQATMVTSQW